MSKKSIYVLVSIKINYIIEDDPFFTAISFFNLKDIDSIT